MISPQNEYPASALPPKLYDAVSRLERSIQSPFAMIASSAIAAIALASQRGYLVERKPGLVLPVGMAFMTLALPSERKSATDSRLLLPIRNFENRLDSQTLEKLKEWRVAQAILNAKKTGITRAITRSITRGEDASEYEQKLITLLKSASEKPKHTRLIANDATADAILQFLQNYGNSCGVMIDEGGLFFDSRASKHAALFAALWSGNDRRVDRTNDDSFTLRSPRFTISIMTQPKVLHSFLANKGKHWRDTGLLSRFLFSYPVSTIGFRAEDVNFPIVADLSAYDARILEILSSAPCSGSVENVTLKFEDSARRSLAEYANLIEINIRPNAFYSDISDAASKIAENAARMAALFHIFEGYEGPIKEDTLSRAISICNWHLAEFKNLFAQHPQIPMIEQDAMDIESCMRDYYAEGKSQPCPKNRISQYSTKELRAEPPRREAAFQYLINNNRIRYVTLYRDKTTYVVFFSQDIPEINSHSTWNSSPSLGMFRPPVRNL